MGIGKIKEYKFYCPDYSLQSIETRNTKFLESDQISLKRLFLRMIKLRMLLRNFIMGLKVVDYISRPINMLCDNQATLCSINNDKVFNGEM